MSAQTLEYRLWPEPLARAVGETLRHFVEAWRGDWGVTLEVDVESPRPAQALTDAGPPAIVDWHRLADNLWCARSPGFGRGLHPLGSVVLGDDMPDNSLGAMAAERALRALFAACDEAMPPSLGVSSAELPAYALRHGSGYLSVRIRVGGEMLTLLVGPERMGKPRAGGAPRALAPLRPMQLRRAARDAQCDLQVMLGSAEADVATLATLRVGDVLRLEQRIDQPLQVRHGSEHAAVCAAAIGQRGGRMAARLLRPKTSLEN